MSKSIGILGGGQLAMMMTEAAIRMGHKVTVLDPTDECPASLVGAAQVVGSFKDKDTVLEFVQSNRFDVLTYDIESVNSDALVQIETSRDRFNKPPIYPPPRVLKTVEDKWRQKQFYHENNIQTPKFYKVGDVLEDISINNNRQFVLKTRTGGYDGKGVWMVTKGNILSTIRELVGDNNDDDRLDEFYLEEKIDIEEEFAIMICRNNNCAKPETCCYPITHLYQDRGICIQTKTPLYIDMELGEQAYSVARQLGDLFEYTGVMGIEFFLTKDKRILVNEVSPRVHNSGHYTIEGCYTSQFENHIRVITTNKYPSSCKLINHQSTVVMENILADGEEEPSVERYMSRGFYNDSPRKTSFHWYNKKVKPGRDFYKKDRKIGHFTYFETKERGVKDVYVIMGSSSDLPHVKPCIELLNRFNISFEVDIVSAHRSPHWMYEFCEDLEDSGTKVVIAAAGGAASLCSMVSSLLPCIPVIGIPIVSKYLNGVDSIHSVLATPPGMPVLTMHINGSLNAAISALQILGRKDILKQLKKENQEKVERQRKEELPKFLKTLDIEQ